jgi:hypothetical protein
MIGGGIGVELEHEPNLQKGYLCWRMLLSLHHAQDFNSHAQLLRLA